MGIGIIVVLFCVLGLLLYLTVKPNSDKVYTPEESIFVQQRMKNIQKR